MTDPVHKDGLALADVQAAADRIRGMVLQTPVMASQTIDDQVGAQLVFKCENFQKVGAFKARGAANAVRCLSDAQAARGVATHSSGNHGAALAWAASLRGIPAYVVMPASVSRFKRQNVARYGAQIIDCEPTLAAREAAAAELVARTGAAYIHPYDDFRVMAGQGTAALELLEQSPDLDMVICPVGGGGLVSGVSTAVKALAPSCRVIAAEPEQADDAFRSMRAGRIMPMSQGGTIADGLRAHVSERTFAQMRRDVDEVATVSEEAIVQAMRTLWETLKIIIEPSSAVAYAAISEGKVDVAGLRAGIILTGGNVDLDHLPWLPTRAS